jgi:hypothetical protein
VNSILWPSELQPLLESRVAVSLECGRKKPLPYAVKRSEINDTMIRNAGSRDKFTARDIYTHNLYKVATEHI